MCLIEFRHYNAYLLVPRLVYHLWTKLKNDVIHNCIGQIEKDLIPNKVWVCYKSKLDALVSATMHATKNLSIHMCDSSIVGVQLSLLD